MISRPPSTVKRAFGGRYGQTGDTPCRPPTVAGLPGKSGWLARLRITSNDKCITCGECSRFCQVGIDVMGFAKNQQEFSNQNSSCIHCGICITVCPMDVLEFDGQPTARGQQAQS